jgi:hypothetical protein
MEFAEKGILTKAETQAKYGWWDVLRYWCRMCGIEMFVDQFVGTAVKLMLVLESLLHKWKESLIQSGCCNIYWVDVKPI